MPVKNATKNVIISNNAKLCDDALSKFRGLMFSKYEKSLIFKFGKEKIIALHMLFVFYPIDVLFINKNKFVVEKKENFKPFTFYSSKKKAMYVIELQQGLIKKSRTEILDKIEF